MEFHLLIKRKFNFPIKIIKIFPTSSVLNNVSRTRNSNKLNTKNIHLNV